MFGSVFAKYAVPKQTTVPIGMVFLFCKSLLSCIFLVLIQPLYSAGLSEKGKNARQTYINQCTLDVLKNSVIQLLQNVEEPDYKLNVKVLTFVYFLH